MLRFTDDDFDEEQALTIGVDFKTKIINVDGVNVKLGKFIFEMKFSSSENIDLQEIYFQLYGILLVRKDFVH